MRIRRGELAVVVAATVWALVLTYPLIARMDSSMYAMSWHTDNPGGSWVIGVWSTWWTKQAWLSGQDFRIVPIIAAPFGVDWRAAPYQYLSVYITTGLALIVGELTAHNVFVLLSFPLSALTAYWLCFDLTGSRRAAIVGGLIYAFSTYHWARTTVHFNMAMLHWVPLFVLALLRWGDQPTAKRGLVLGAAFALVTLDNYYYGFFMLLVAVAFLVVHGLWAVWVGRSVGVSRNRIASGAVAVLSATLVVLPFVWPFVGRWLEDRASLGSPPWLHTAEQAAAYGTQPWMLLVPSFRQPLWDEALSEFYQKNYRLNEQSLYLGMVALGLAAWGWQRSRDSRTDWRFERDRLTLAFLFIFMLWVSGPSTISIGPVALPGPSSLLSSILPMFRAYTRIGGLAMVALCPLAACGVARMIQRWPSRRDALTILAGAAVLFDFLFLPATRNLDLSQTPAVYGWLATQKNDSIVVEYPLYPSDMTRVFRYLFYQRVHHKRLFNAVGLSLDSEVEATRRKIVDVTAPDTPRILRELGIRYVLVHTDLYGDAGAPGVADGPPPRLQDMPPGLDLVERFGPTLVYEVVPGDSGGRWQRRLD